MLEEDVDASELFSESEEFNSTFPLLRLDTPDAGLFCVSDAVESVFLFVLLDSVVPESDVTDFLSDSDASDADEGVVGVPLSLSLAYKKHDSFTIITTTKPVLFC